MSLWHYHMKGVHRRVHRTVASVRRRDAGLPGASESLLTFRCGWRYRVASVAGVVVLTAVAVALVNNATIQSIATTIPILSRLPTDPPTGPEFTIELLVTIAVVVSVFLPLYKPRPRRILMR